MNFIKCEKVETDSQGNKYYTKVLIDLEKITCIEPGQNGTYMYFSYPEDYIIVNVSFDAPVIEEHGPLSFKKSSAYLSVSDTAISDQEAFGVSEIIFNNTNSSLIYECSSKEVK